MLSFIKNLFGLNKPQPVKATAPYKIEEPKTVNKVRAISVAATSVTPTNKTRKPYRNKTKVKAK